MFENVSGETPGASAVNWIVATPSPNGFGGRSLKKPETPTIEPPSITPGENVVGGDNVVPKPVMNGPSVTECAATTAGFESQVELPSNQVEGVRDRDFNRNGVADANRDERRSDDRRRGNARVQRSQAAS